MDILNNWKKRLAKWRERSEEREEKDCTLDNERRINNVSKERKKGRDKMNAKLRNREKVVWRMGWE